MGTSPCVFKVNSSFYDFTPIKLAIPNPKVPYYDGTPEGPLQSDQKYWFVFGWCQQLNDIATQTLCQQDVFAGRLDANPPPTPDSACMAYSGGSAKDDIDTKAMKGVPQTVSRMQS